MEFGIHCEEDEVVDLNICHEKGWDTCSVAYVHRCTHLENVVINGRTLRKLPK